MNLSDLGGIVSKAAPLLGSALTFLNPAMGATVEVIAHMFSADPKDINDIIAKVNSDPDATLKLKALEAQHQDSLEMAKIGDRENAREREEKIVSVTGKRDYIIDLIAILVIVGFFLLCLVNYFVKLSDDHVVTMLIGQISSGFVIVLSYYFGSSNK